MRPQDSRAPQARSAGQVLVLFALTITVLLGAAGMAFDIGRFYGERRFLQNATDAAALAGGQALVSGQSTDVAAETARVILNRNLLADPNGVQLQIAAGETPRYEPGYSGDPSHLLNGILVTTSSVRVAAENSIGYTFGRVVGLDQSAIGARSLVTLRGDLVPIAARHYLNAPGPSSTASYPCVDDTRAFLDLVSTADTACLGSESDASLRSDPSSGMAYDPANPNNDPAHHGPIATLVGQGAQPSNMASFRGFVSLDIRNFATTSSNLFYNGVTVATQPETLKNLEAGWVQPGYPGPNFPPATTPPDVNDQVGIMDGNSSGSVIDSIAARYIAGDEILCGVYSGTVMTIPDFTLSTPSQVNIGTTQNRDGQVKMSVSKNAAFTGTVETTSLADPGDANNPLTLGTLSPITFSPSPATPNTEIQWDTFSTAGATAGISTIWIKGHSSSPYLTDHFHPVGVNIGAVARDFTNDGANQSFYAAQTGDTATGTITFMTDKNAAAFSGTVTLTLEGHPADNFVLPSGLGSASVSPSSFSLGSGASTGVTVTINSGSLAPGSHPLVIRATGTNADGQQVTHLIPISLDISTAGTTNQYVDLMGFAVFRITSANSNSIDGYAITPVIADMNDPRLRRAQMAKLTPWS